MLTGKKIIVTGATGRIAAPMIERLAPRNEIHAAARFGDSAQREELQRLGVGTVRVDLDSGQGIEDLPTDADHLLHFAASLEADLDYDRAIRVNAESTGLLMQHCQRVQSVLIASTGSVYRPVADPRHAYRETDPLGDAFVVGLPTYSISKIAQEAVARTAARMLGIRVVIARIVIAYGDKAGTPARHLRTMLAQRPVVLRFDPNLYNPIHVDDMTRQLEPLLDVAAITAPIINWGGDEVVSSQQWCAYFGELIGAPPQIVLETLPGTSPGIVLDVTRRQAITGPCLTPWRAGMAALVDNIRAETTGT